MDVQGQIFILRLYLDNSVSECEIETFDKGISFLVLNR